MAKLLLTLVIPALAVAAQERPPRDGGSTPTRVIRGEVRADDDSAALLRRARVILAGSAAPAVYTNEAGVFELEIPEAATAIVRISKPGFAPAQVAIAPAAGSDVAAVRLARGAAINATVFDDAGPVVGVDVRVRRMTTPAERGRAPVDVTIATDDLGEFRLGSLPAGTYELSILKRFDAATPEPVRVTVRPGDEIEAPLFFRDASAAEARTVESYVAGYEAGRMAGLPAGRGVLGNAAVSGRVVDPYGRGVAGAVVRLTPVSAGRERLGATSAQGRFQITGVAAGTYRVVAAKTGFVNGEFGQERAAQPGRIITVRDRQRLDRIDIGLPRGAVVTGAVADPDGEPMEGLAMHVWRMRYWNGRRIAEAVADVAMRRTDDHGRYRLFGLQPGTYYVVAADTAVASGDVVTGAPRSFYPGAPTLNEASTVHVDVGVDAEAAHIAFNPARGWTISGVAYDSEDHPLERPLVLAGSTRSGVAAAPQVARMAGRQFTFTNVMPGSYVLHAMQRLELENGLLQEFRSQFIDVGEFDITGLRVVTAKGSRVGGRIFLERDGPIGGTTPLTFDVVSADPDFAPPPNQFRPWTIRINPDRSFEVDGLSGPVRFTGFPTNGLFLRSADVGGRNAADEPVTFGTASDWRGTVGVVYSSAGGEVSGRALNGRKEPMASYVAVVFPTDRGRWYTGSRYITTAVPDEEARFRLPMVPPGEYFVAAVEALPAGSLEDPDLLDRLSEVSRRVDLSAGERLSLDLPLTALPK